MVVFKRRVGQIKLKKSKLSCVKNLNKIYFYFRGVASIKNMLDPRSAVHSAPKKCHLAKKTVGNFQLKRIKNLKDEICIIKKTIL
jgi:hypothetical protein